MKNLEINDFVGISFWIISISLAATTGFLIIERKNVKEKWKTPVSVSAIVTGIAASHYFYMRKIGYLFPSIGHSFHFDFN